MEKTVFFILFFIVLFGCGSKHENSNFSTFKVDKKTVIENIYSNDRKLIKNGHIRFRTNDLEKTNVFIKNTVNKFGAYISVDNMNQRNTQIGYDLTIRVPAIKFDSLMDFILANASIKQLNNKSSLINDVTDDFIDTQARIKVKKESEQKLIESTEGRMKYLSEQVNYSTIKVSLMKRQTSHTDSWAIFGMHLKRDGKSHFILSHYWPICGLL